MADAKGLRLGYLVEKGSISARKGRVAFYRSLGFSILECSIENFFLSKADQPVWEKDDAWKEEFELD